MINKIKKTLKENSLLSTDLKMKFGEYRMNEDSDFSWLDKFPD